MTTIKVNMSYVRKPVLSELKRKWNKRKIKGEFNPEEFCIVLKEGDDLWLEQLDRTTPRYSS